MDISPLTANEHGYRKPTDLSEQLPSYTLNKCEKKGIMIAIFSRQSLEEMHVLMNTY